MPEKRGRKFHKDTFDKTTEDRRQMVLDVAIDEFAANGYNATSINDIAKKARISIGAMYSYFASKEDLFLTIVNNANELMDRILGEVVENSKDIFDVVERMVAAARKVGQEYPKLNQIYLDITTQALSAMSARLSSELERITPGLLSQFLAEGKFNGILRQDLDERVASYCIDNILMMYQFSFSSDYYKDRMKIFVGPEKMDDIKHLEQEIVRFIRASITAS